MCRHNIDRVTTKTERSPTSSANGQSNPSVPNPDLIPLRPSDPQKGIPLPCPLGTVDCEGGTCKSCFCEDHCSWR